MQSAGWEMGLAWGSSADLGWGNSHTCWSAVVSWLRWGSVCASRIDTKSEGVGLPHKSPILLQPAGYLGCDSLCFSVMAEAQENQQKLVSLRKARIRRGPLAQLHTCHWLKQDMATWAPHQGTGRCTLPRMRLWQRCIFWILLAFSFLHSCFLPFYIFP